MVQFCFPDDEQRIRIRRQERRNEVSIKCNTLRPINQSIIRPKGFVKKYRAISEALGTDSRSGKQSLAEKKN